MTETPERDFNTAGPCHRDEHYMLPPARRLGRAMEFMGRGRWFVLAAGRQTGKTTSLQWLVEHERTRGERLAVWIDLESAREDPSVATAMRSVLSALDRGLAMQCADLPRPDEATVDAWLRTPTDAVVRYLSAICAASPKPVVLLLDEADGLVGAAMVSFLTQRLAPRGACAGERRARGDARDP